MATTATLRYVMEFDAKYAEKMNRVLRVVKGRVEGVDGSFKRASASSAQLNRGIRGLTSRALMTIPVWLALRNVFLSFVNTIREGLKHIREFDKVMARIAAVTRGVANQAEALKGLRNEIRRLSTETGESVDKVGEAFYRFATAGHSFIVSFEGMKIALKTGIAVMGDTTVVARTISDVYNLMKDNIQGATTVQEKMNKIGSRMAILYANNAFELNEFNAGLRTFTGVAKNYNLTLDELMALLAASHTLMQRGGTAGAQLSRTFMMMTDRIEKVNLVLGRTVDLSKERVFNVYLELLKKINAQYGDSALKVAKLNEIFGMKGIRVTGSFAANMEVLVRELERLKRTDTQTGMKELNRLFELQMNTIDRQLKRFKELKDVMFEAFLIGFTGATDYLAALTNINDYMKNTLIPRAFLLGETLRMIRSPIKSGGYYGTTGLGEEQQLFPGNIQSVKNYWRKAGGRVSKEEAAQRRVDKYGFDPYGANIEEQLRDRQVQEDLDFAKWKKKYRQADSVGRYQMQRDVGVPEEEAMAGMGLYERATVRYMEMEKSFGKRLTQEQKQVELDKIRVQMANELTEAYKATFEGGKMILQNADLLAVRGASQLQIEQERLEIMEDRLGLDVTAEQLATQILKVQKAINKEIIEGTASMSSAFQGAFKDMLMMDKGPREALDAFAQEVRSSMMESLAEGITGMTGATGFFEGMAGAGIGIKAAFGGISGKISSGFDSGSKEAYVQIYNAFLRGGASASAQIRGALVSPSGPAVKETAPGIGDTTIEGGTGGAFGYSRKMVDGKWQYFKGKNKIKGTFGQRAMASGAQGAGVLAGSALTGYSAYQQARAGGMGKKTSAAMGVAGGVGAGIMGAGLAGIITAEAMAGPIGWIALALTLAAVGLGIFGKKKSAEQTQTQTQTSMNTVASRIDISNNKLELINRNLVALRATMETYILPNSAYFAEKTTIEDEFSLHSRR